MIAALEANFEAAFPVTTVTLLRIYWPNLTLGRLRVLARKTARRRRNGFLTFGG